MSERAYILEPVSADDPCGPDLRWEPDMLELVTRFSMLLEDGEGVVVGARAASGRVSADDLLQSTIHLLARTKSILVMGVYAQVRWILDGLGGYAEAMDELVRSVEAWPGPDDGVHPRADPDDGDLGERESALARVLANVPRLAATLGWGKLEEPPERARAAATLRGVFTRWQSRLSGALAEEPPPDAQTAWRAIRSIRGFEDSLGESGEAATEPDPEEEASSPHPIPRAPHDAWELVALAAERMQEQSPHSPAVLMLRLVLGWQGMDLAQISEASRSANGQMGIDQMMDWAKKQISGSA